MLFCAYADNGKMPFWWRFKRWRLNRLVGLHLLGALRPLNKADIGKWQAAFPDPLRTFYQRDRLRSELEALFEGRWSGIRYIDVRRKLVDDGAMDRARITRP